MWTDRRIGALLFGLFFCLYMLPLALHPKRFTSPGFFGADDMFDTFEGRPTGAIQAKHPLFIAIAPVYRVGAWLFSGLPGNKGHNLAMAFPMAILGAASVWVAYLVFLRNRPQREPAALFAALYGMAGSQWFFSSLPETYVLTAQCTNLLLWFLLRTPIPAGVREIYQAAAINALACYAAPQQILCALIPFFQWLREEGLTRSTWARAVRYGLVMLAAFVIPYEVLLKLGGMGWKFGSKYVAAYSHLENLIHPGWAALVGVNFLVYSVISPAVHPRYFRDPSFSILSVLDAGWIALAVLFGAFCIWSLRGVTNRDRMAVPLAAFLACYLLFFLYFNPIESFLYSLPAVLPWLLLLHSGFTSKWGNSRRVLLYSLIAGAAVQNLHFRLFLGGLR
jgi:hypothetical protein